MSNISVSFFDFQIADENNDMRYLVDGADPTKSNWIRYINSAMTEDSVNLDAVQYKGEMYYQVTGAIPAGNVSTISSKYFCHRWSVSLHHIPMPTTLEIDCKACLANLTT